jgi:uncharacterized membrane protein
MRVLSEEMQQKFSDGAVSIVWLAAGAVLLLSAFGFFMLALLFLLISLGIKAYISAAILALLLALAGALMALKGRAQLRGGSLVPDRTFARLRRDTDIFERSRRDA